MEILASLFLFALLRSHSPLRTLPVLISWRKKSLLEFRTLSGALGKLGTGLRRPLMVAGTVSSFPSLTLSERDLNFGAFRADYGVRKTFQKGQLFGLFNTFVSLENAQNLEDPVRPSTGPEASGMCHLLACLQPSEACTPCVLLNPTP